MKQRLEGGLFCLQQLSVIIAFGCVGNPSCVSRAIATLSGAELGLYDVQWVLREAAAAVSVEDDFKSEDSDEILSVEALKFTRQKYIEWGAALGALLAADTSPP